jgi:large exoprotein involved in heme utilization and adhesion
LSRIANNVNANATGNNKANIFQAVTQARETGDPSVIFGSIFITAESLSVTDGASVTTSTFGTGNAGLVYVDAEDSVSVAGFQEVSIPGLPEPERVRSQLASAVGSGARGNAGGIFIETGSLSLTDYSLINSSTSGAGTAGAVFVEADGAVSLANDSVIFNNVEAGGNGNGGLISLTAESLSLTNGAQLQTIARNVEKGNAGAVTVNVRDTVTISGTGNPLFGNQGVALPSAIFSSVGSGVNGNAGNIQISTRALSLSNRGRIDTSLSGVGTAGSIFIEATDSVSLASEAEIETVINLGATESRGASSPFAGNIGSVLSGRGGDVTGTILISTGSLSLTDGSVLNTSTLGEGNAGAVVVVARDDVSLKGGAIGSIVGDQATGNAGAILMSVGSLSIASTSTHPAGLTTETDGQGDAGLIFVEADKDISIRGEESGNEVGISSESAGGDNSGGGIILGARSLFLRDGAKVSVDNQGSGVAGDIIIGTREDIILRDQGAIRAIAASGRGGNIVLTSGDFLLLLDESQIRTDAFNLNNPNGNGGNIFAVTKYLIAAPYNTNDIIANAIQDVGGNIFVLAGRIYDIEERPQVVPTNDIDASSDFNRDGTVSASDLNIDPTQGFTNLPANLIDPSSLIAETCAPRGSIAERKNNQFTNTGPGGLPPDPNAAFPGEAVVNDLEVPEENERKNTEEGNSTGEPSSANPTNLPPVETASSQDPTLVEAQGWVYGENGTVLFTAQASTVTPNSPVLRPASTCNNVSTSLQPR